MINEATDSEIYQKLSVFKSRDHSIGNFMPLPNKTINRVSINNARNSAWNPWHSTDTKVGSTHIKI